MFVPQSERPSFAPIQHNWRNHNVPKILIFPFNDSGSEQADS
jgi:hypothetical protein